MGSLLEWPVIASGDIARSIDPETARTGQMADAWAMDKALLEALPEGPCIIDGYPRTPQQMVMLPGGFSVVVLDIAPSLALDRIAHREKHGWDENARMREQIGGINQIMRHADEIVSVYGKTPGEVVFRILSSPYLGPPVRRSPAT